MQNTLVLVAYDKQSHEDVGGAHNDPLGQCASDQGIWRDFD